MNLAILQLNFNIPTNNKYGNFLISSQPQIILVWFLKTWMDY